MLIILVGVQVVKESFGLLVQVTLLRCARGHRADKVLALFVLLNQAAHIGLNLRLQELSPVDLLF